jgi:hypothetical protein
MREVFVDTSGEVALKHKGDAFWRAATTLHWSLLTAGARYITSNYEDHRQENAPRILGTISV